MRSTQCWARQLANFDLRGATLFHVGVDGDPVRDRLGLHDERCRCEKTENSSRRRASMCAASSGASRKARQQPQIPPHASGEVVAQPASKRRHNGYDFYAFTQMRELVFVTLHRGRCSRDRVVVHVSLHARSPSLHLADTVALFRLRKPSLLPKRGDLRH